MFLLGVHVSSLPLHYLPADPLFFFLPDTGPSSFSPVEAFEISKELLRSLVHPGQLVTLATCCFQGEKLLQCLCHCPLIRVGLVVASLSLQYLGPVMHNYPVLERFSRGLIVMPVGKFLPDESLQPTEVRSAVRYAMVAFPGTVFGLQRLERSASNDRPREVRKELVDGSVLSSRSNLSLTNVREIKQIVCHCPLIKIPGYYYEWIRVSSLYIDHDIFNLSHSLVTLAPRVPRWEVAGDNYHFSRVALHLSCTNEQFKIPDIIF